MSAVSWKNCTPARRMPPPSGCLNRLFDTFAKLTGWLRLSVRLAKGGANYRAARPKYGFDEAFLSRITHDVLIALSARRIGASIVTNNLKDLPADSGVCGREDFAG